VFLSPANDTGIQRRSQAVRCNSVLGSANHTNSVNRLLEQLKIGPRQPAIVQPECSASHIVAEKKHVTFLNSPSRETLETSLDELGRDSLVPLRIPYGQVV
jgi:hypothetical protein